jgi:hypothetical protein
LDFYRKKDLFQPAVDGIEHGLEAPGDVELLENAVQMTLDRFLADEKGFGNSFIRQTFHKAAKNLLLPLR